MKKFNCTLLFSALVMIAGLMALGQPASAAVKQHKPNPPSAVTITAINTAMNVAWSAPATYVGPAVTSYRVIGKVRIGGHWVYPSCTVGGATFQCELTGLTNGLPYLVSVTATNSIGTSIAAKVSPVIPTTAQNCSFIGPHANLQNCYLPGTNLAGDDLTGANMSGANLSYSVFANVNLTGVNLSGAILTGITSGGVTGTGYTLPTGWGVVGGYLVGPSNGVTSVDLSVATFGSVDLTNAAMYGDNLTGATLTGAGTFTGTNLSYDNFANADLTGAFSLSGAILTGATWSNTTCPDGSNSDTNAGSTCIGFGI